jgi:hypothetical protein
MLLTNKSSLGLWHEVVQGAEKRCQVALEDKLESYLISLLVQYTNRPEVVRQIFAEAFLKALQLHEIERNSSLQNVGDQCLLFAGLFPHAAKRRQVKISYFVDLGQSAYAGISKRTNDLFSSLALQFVVLMDVLQSIRPTSDLLPLEAYEQWNEVGSQRALKILKEYTNAIPIKKIIR